MKALTLHRPWQRAIMRYGKDIENRGWKPPNSLIGHRLAIHAGQQIDGAGIVRLMSILRGNKLAYAHDAQALCGDPGEIVGTVSVLGWVFGDPGARGLMKWSSSFTDREARDYLNSNWFSGPYGWVLRDFQLLRNPIPCRGYQKLWNVPGEIEEAIRGQLAQSSA